MAEVRFTDIDVVQRVLDTDVLPQEYLAAREGELDIDAVRPPVGMDIRTGIYRDCLGNLAVARATDAQTPDTRKHWQPSDDDTVSIRSELAHQRRTLGILNNIDDYVRRGRHAQGLFDEQLPLFEEIVDTFSTAQTLGECQAAVLSATGTGKTHQIVELLRAIHNKDRETTLSEPLHVRSLVLTEDKELVMQNSGNDGEHGIKVFAPELEVGVYYAQEKDLDKEVTVMTYASFVRAADAGVIKHDDFDVILADEADLALSYRRYPLLKEFKEDVISFGFTATDAPGEHKNLSKLYDRIIAGPNVAEAIDAGVLTPVQLWYVSSGEQLVLPEAVRRMPDIPASILEPLAHKASRNQIAIEFAGMFTQELGTHGIIECIDGNYCQHAYDLAEQLRQVEVTDYDTRERRYLRAEAVDSTNPNRDQIIEAYRNGDIDWLLGNNLFVRGKDWPITSGYIGLRDTFSMRRATQVRGRVPRPDQNNPDKVAQYVEIVDDVRYANGERTEVPRTMYHVLGLEEYEQGTIYGKLDVAPGAKLPSYMLYHKIPEGLQQLLASSQAAQVLETRLIGTPNVLPEPEPGYVSMRDLEAKGVGRAFVEKRMDEWGVDPTYFSLEGRKTLFIPEDVAADLVDIKHTPKDQRAGKRAAMPPATWGQVSRGKYAEITSPPSNILLTHDAQAALLSQGVPAHVLKPRAFFSSNRAPRGSDHAHYYYSPRQIAVLKRATAGLPEAQQNWKEFVPMFHTSSSYTIHNFSAKPYQNEHYATDPSPLVRQAHAETTRLNNVANDIYEEYGIKNLIRRRQDKDGVVWVGNYISDEEAHTVTSAVLAAVPEADSRHASMNYVFQDLSLVRDLSSDSYSLGIWNYPNGRQDFQRVKEAFKSGQCRVEGRLAPAYEGSDLRHGELFLLIDEVTQIIENNISDEAAKKRLLTEAFGRSRV